MIKRRREDDDRERWMLLIAALLALSSYFLLLMLPEHQSIPKHMRLYSHTIGTHWYSCEKMFRLSVSQILELADRLLPPVFYTSANDKTNAVEAICITLRRLVFPARWYDLVSIFGRSEGSLCRIWVATLE